MVDGGELAREFERTFGRTPQLYRAPGRVNLIGEHTDYNDGFVMPMALDRSTWVAAAPRDDRTIVIWSEEFQELATLNLVGADPRVRPTWARYVYGVAALLELRGADMLITSDGPIGA